MKSQAAVLYEMGRKAPFGGTKPLSIEEVEVGAPGPREVVVKVAAAGLCHSDLSVIDGSRPRPMPMLLGHEAAGVVHQVGPDVTDLAVGDHVVFSFLPMCGRCIACATGRPVMCTNGAKANAAGTMLGGAKRFCNAKGEALHHHLGVSAFSQYTVAAQESLIKIPSDLPLETAALFGCAVITGVGAVLNTANVTPGMSVAVFGMGGVGLAAVMGAKLAGAYPIVAVDLLDAKLELAKACGATHVVNAKTDVISAIKDVTSGGADVTIEAVGSAKVLAQAYGATARGGTTVTVGLPHPEQQLAIQAVSLVAEERTLKGSYMGSAVPKRDVLKYIALYRAGLLPVEKLFSGAIELPKINEAFDALAKGEVVRNVLRFA
ncbi:MAG: zinc-dependent alcohol dehydrogenase family protein [Kofleriaceae bacterium]